VRFARCEHHYIEYAERTQKIIDDINRRYPATAPADFDPAFAGSFDTSRVLLRII
jgi:hypothetical protein